MPRPTAYREDYSKSLFKCPLCPRQVRAHELVYSINQVPVRQARLFCARCIKKFNAMPSAKKAAFLIQRFEEDCGDRQAIYALNDPVTRNRRYVGRTADPKRRYNGHLQKARSYDKESVKEHRRLLGVSEIPGSSRGWI